MRRPGCTASMTSPIPSGPIRAAATSRSSTLMTSPRTTPGRGRQTGPFDDLHDQAATTEAMEALADLSDLADPAQRGAGGLFDGRARAVEGVGGDDDVVEPDGARRVLDERPAGRRDDLVEQCRRCRRRRRRCPRAASGRCPARRRDRCADRCRTAAPCHRRRSARGAPTARPGRRRPAIRRPVIAAPAGRAARPKKERPSACSSARLRDRLADTVAGARPPGTSGSAARPGRRRRLQQRRHLAGVHRIDARVALGGREQRAG